MNAIELAPDHTAENAAVPSTPRILIVDDEQAMQLLASAIIKKLGYDALSARIIAKKQVCAHSSHHCILPRTTSILPNNAFTLRSHLCFDANAEIC